MIANENIPEIEILVMWPTLIASGDFPRAEAINGELSRAILDLCVGRAGAVDEHDYPHQVDIASRIPDALMQFFVDATGAHLQRLTSSPQRVRRQHLTRFWANVHDAGAIYRPHCHDVDRTILIGTYYVAVPPTETPFEGRLCFLDPRRQFDGHNTYAKVHGFRDTSFVPRPGQLLLFPPHLVHYVNPHRSAEHRLGITFHVEIDAVRGAP